MKKFSELTEVNLSGAAVTFLTYKFLLLLRQPWERWEAFELGLIDKKGDLVKKPKTKDEKKALDKLTNLVRKIKKILGKYINNEKILSFLVTIYLLKEDSCLPRNKAHKKLALYLPNYLDAEENKLVINVLNEHLKQTDV